MFISPEAPNSNGVPVSGSIKRTFSGVPHLTAICTVLLIKYTSEWKVPSVSVGKWYAFSSNGNCCVSKLYLPGPNKSNAWPSLKKTAS